jgi:protease-4
MSTSTKWFLGILAVLLFVAVVFSLLLVVFMRDASQRSDVVLTGSGDRVALVELKGVIIGSEDIVRQLKKYRDDSSIRAILLRIDSPGGGVVPSQEIYEEVRKTRDSGKPVVVSMGSLAASGGYYVACGASRIVANKATLTGSVGVIAEFLQVHDLLDKIGVDFKIVKSGKLKDAGVPTRRMTEDDQKYFQALMDDVHAQFERVVQQERDLSASEVRALADGRVFTGTQAVGLGLVDTLGTFEDAVLITAELAGIEGEPTLVRERVRRSFLESLLGGSMEEARALSREILSRPVMSYRFVEP